MIKHKLKWRGNKVLTAHTLPSERGSIRAVLEGAESMETGCVPGGVGLDDRMARGFREGWFLL